ncbi:sensor histidine kinase [Plesiocystis pacifica SIR-1]|uniref:histidine kinase n=1 Tax=Plesiocystis pacifica SIR-1 TaxID=391625 RepID=A6G316_9BACT|nr:ATP-binding protein [Plesiocystis pacifica]EDM79641.1 sensor histidine kinase [Plesiocystis pacifica SIR-1]
MSGASQAATLSASDRRAPLERLIRREDIERTLAPYLGGAFGPVRGLGIFDLEGARYAGVGPAVEGWSQLPAAAVEGLRSAERAFEHDGVQFAIRPCYAGADRVGSLVIGMAGEGAEHLAEVTEALGGTVGALLQAGFATWVTSEMHLAASESNHRALQQQNAELERAIAHLRDVDQLKSNFLATVSHELRTPLTSIIGFSEMLAKGIAGPLNEEQTEYANMILDRGEELLRLITQILEMSKMEMGTVRLKLRPTPLADVVGRAFGSAVIPADRAHVNLVRDFADDLPLMLVDPDKVLQVLINLVTNGIKFNRPDGHVAVRAELAPIRRPFEEDFFGEEVADAMRVSVSDTGIGIPEDQLARIFDAFYQVDSSSTREHGGAGLGLSIVKKLIEAHGGEIWAESIVGVGTTFHFTLPLAEGAEG